MSLNVTGRKPPRGGNYARARGDFGILPRLALKRQADSDFANVPVSSVENFQLQTFILNGTGAVELEQFGERQIFDKNRLDQQRTGPGVERKTARYIGRRYLEGIAGRVDGKDGLVWFDRSRFLGIVHDLSQIVVIDYGTVWQRVGWIRRLLRLLQFIFA